MTKACANKCRLKYFPISFFSIILGMAGASTAFQKIEELIKSPINVSYYLIIFTTLLFGIISSVYLMKIIKYKSYVAAEFHNPIKLSFFPTFSISLLLLSGAFLSINLSIAKYFWLIGSTVHIILTFKIISIWIHHTKFEITHMNPAWFIPAVGNILVPIAGVNFAPPEILWFFYSVGFLFWIILLVIFFNRIIFHAPLPDKLLPTLFILIAPPSLGFVSFVKLTGGINEFAMILYYFALFLALLLLTQIKLFTKIKFYLSWWAYSFPLAAITIASILMFHKTGLTVFRYISLGFFTLLCGLLVILISKTIKAISKKEICLPEE